MQESHDRSWPAAAYVTCLKNSSSSWYAHRLWVLGAAAKCPMSAHFSTICIAPFKLRTIITRQVQSPSTEARHIKTFLRPIQGKVGLSNGFCSVLLCVFFVCFGFALLRSQGGCRNTIYKCPFLASHSIHALLHHDLHHIRSVCQADTQKSGSTTRSEHITAETR